MECITTVTKRQVRLLLLLGGCSLFVFSSTAWADFFKIKKIRYHDDPPKDKIGVWEKGQPAKKQQDGKKKPNFVFVPCFEVEVELEKQTKASGLIAKAYFFKDKAKPPVEVLAEPSAAGKPWRAAERQKLPMIMEGRKAHSLFFAVPESLRETIKQHEVLVVFGDQHEVAAESYPFSAAVPMSYAFAEKETYLNPTQSALDRKDQMNPVTEVVVKTKHPKVPQITMLVRPPKGMKDGSQAKGILAWCVFANKVSDIRKKLQGLDDEVELSGLMKFADKHQFALMAWGSRSIWDAGSNYDELTEERFEKFDESFDLVADAWEDGVKEFHRQYGLPNRNFFLVGTSSAAQWAHRLALRKPQYFHAVSIHIPSSFDKPRPEASHILWCLTTGELESGYERSKRFYMDCRKLNYPIIYKAFMGIGHAELPITRDMRMEFLEYAAQTLAERESSDTKTLSTFSRNELPGAPWPQCYQNPEFIGDIVNQELFPISEIEMVPPGFRVPLANKALADEWQRQL